MRALATATRGKGTRGLLKRLRSIAAHYGWSSRKILEGLEHFSEVLQLYGCSATFPVPASTLARSNGTFDRFREQGIEFAVHGYLHVDHTRLTRQTRMEHLELARRLFSEKHIAARGFRAPYLRWNEETMEAVQKAGFLYDGSAAVVWDVVREIESPEYRQAVAFYGAMHAAHHPSLPRWNDGLVRIPYCLPDDEALVERLNVSEESMSRIWLEMLRLTYEHGELFTLGLHPERFFACEAALTATLRHASKARPHVWMARLEDIAEWWIARARTEIAIRETIDGRLHVSVRGPDGLTVLARGVALEAQSLHPWDDRFQVVRGNDFHLPAGRRPFIGVSPSSPPRLVSFLRQQGYIVEEAEDGHNCTHFLDRDHFEEIDERPLLLQIEQGDFPLVRLGRWPRGARSALSITGDIDALTLWDYAMRLLKV